MSDPAVLWPALLGVAFLAAGLFSYRREVGPALIAASLAAFAGEHFTAAASLAELVPKWMPARLFITWFVGVAELCAALSLVARRCVRWAAVGLAAMFALFVLTLYLPSAIRHPAIRMVWIFPFREGTFAMGGVALFVIAARNQRPRAFMRLAGAVAIWTAVTLIFFGIQNLLYPQFAPGVPDSQPTSAWVPFPLALGRLVGALLIAFGGAALVRKWSAPAIAAAGWLMVLLACALFAPDFFLARAAAGRVNAINFVFDTLLFGGTLFVIANAQAVSSSASSPAHAA